MVRQAGATQKAKLQWSGMASAFLLFLLWGTAETSAVTLDRDTVPAAGRGEAVVSVAEFGRYALIVKSEPGVSLQLIDRMAGPGEIAGRAGAEDGRLDLFLDEGEYKLVSRGAEGGEGEAKLLAQPFTEVEGEPVQLVEFKPVAAELRDLESRSYWLQLSARRRVILEAAGRYLEDLRLWRDGSWLVDAAPLCEVVDAVEGQPLLNCRLAAKLDPGLYRLAAYGGVGQPWAEESSEAPLHVRFGIPRLGEAGRRAFTVSPFGIDRYRVPAQANFYRLELPEARPAGLVVADLVESDPLRSGGWLAEVRKNSLPPAAEIRLASRDRGERTITVTAPAGQPYVLQHFQQREFYSFSADAGHWLSTVHSGPPGDALDVTALVVEWPRGRRRSARIEPMLSRVVEVGSGQAWARRANLLDTLTVFLRLTHTGKYEVLSKGVDAEFRIEPFLISKPRDYRQPPFQVGGGSWELDEGYYVLTVKPRQKGILDVVLRPQGLLNAVLDRVGREPTAEPPRPAILFGEVQLKSDSSYTLYLNQLPEVASGLVLRSLPLDPTEPLPLALLPGEEVTVPLRVTEAGWLEGKTEGGERLEMAAQGGQSGGGTGRGMWLPRLLLGAGRYTVRVRNSGDTPVAASLAFQANRLGKEEPLPPLPPERLAALPDFPVLTAQAPHFLDLERGQRATFKVEAAEPALYRLESTGMLATSGTLRSRVVTTLRSARSNGVGRNFLLQMYLRQGEYQLSVRPRGDSRGHLGVRLVKAPLQDAGTLALGTVARARLEPEDALLYRFTVPKKGRYRLRALGQAGLFPVRLEDADGWPLVTPGVPGDLTRELEAGEYRLVVLPESVPQRAVALVEALPETRVREGHGPHALPLGEAVEHLWREPEDRQAAEARDDDRPPDRWHFTLPAKVEVGITLGKDMVGEIFALPQEGGQWETVAESLAELRGGPGDGWQGELPAGRYELAVRAARRNNLLPYWVGVMPKALVAGQSRPVAPGGEVPIATDGGLVEIRSFGRLDARGRLYDSDGRLVAGNDDAPDDWNFRLVARLAAGEYRLVVDASTARDEGPETTQVVLEALEERSEVPVRLSYQQPSTLEKTVAEAVLLVPLELPRGAELLLARADGPAVGLSLEERHGDGWRVLSSAEGAAAQDPRLAVALPPAAESGQLRLRLWSLDRRSTKVNLVVAVPRLSPSSEAQLGSGARWTTSGSSALGFQGVLAVQLDRPGVLDFAAAEGLLACTAPGTPCEAIEGPVAVGADRLWLVNAQTGQAGRTVTAGRRRVGAEDSPPLSPPRLLGEPLPLVVDLEGSPEAGPRLVLARSAVGRPGVGLLPAARAERGAPEPAELNPHRTLAAAPGAAVAVSLSAADDPVAVLWDGEKRREGDPLDVRLRRLAYRAVPVEPGAWGRLEGALAGVAARVFELPPGPKRLRLALGEELVAVLSTGERVESIHWSGGRAFAEAVRTEGDRLTLLHTGDGAHRFVVDTLPTAQAGGTPLTPDRPFEAIFLERGWERLEVPPQATGNLVTRRDGTSAGEVLWVGADGRIAAGARIPEEVLGQGGGTLRLPHDAGLVLAWLEPSQGGLSRPWLSEEQAEPTAVEPPAVVPLGGSVQRLVVDLRQASLVSLRAGGGAVTVVRRGAGTDDDERLAIHPDGVAVDAYLPAGRSEIWLRGLAGRPLVGSAEVTAAAVEEIGEGLGPEILLAPGETRLFAFPVERAGPVGLGVRADADVIEVRLLNTEGDLLGEGFVQMRDLEPGTYLLSLTAPLDTRPLRARPAVVGIDPPGTGPPLEVIEEYLAQVGAFEESSQGGAQ